MIRAKNKIKRRLIQKVGGFSTGDNRRKKITQYALSLTEKQKLKFFYNLSERQFYLLFKKSRSVKNKNMNLVFLQSLFFRLDSLLVSSGFLASSRQARQFISHGKVLVNNFLRTKPSYTCCPGDIISFKILNNTNLYTVLKNNSVNVKSFDDQYISVNLNTFSLKVIRYFDDFENINPLKINLRLIVEFYNR
jgi:small subunit ribosomal protein S4